MCGRYLMTSPKDAMKALFGVRADAHIPPRYNISPGQPVLIVRNNESGLAELAAVEWGLVPEWKKELGAKPLINARMETVAEKPSFRSPMKRTRCLVPFDGWYEWKTVNGRKQPFLITPVGGGLQAFAGIWTTWHGPAGEHWLETMAILTGPTNGPMRSLHSRMPLVVKREQYGAWLTPHDPLPRGFLESFDFMPETAFEWRAVNSRLNDVRFDAPECLEPPEQERQHTLF
ncbi:MULTISPECIES: SOS response-associated peptidase [Kordiimonas]|jgi:putative SOS response-associated peptidase YedK|uniref:Abasic site processing protein n=1 Tax=Kordiimonas lacus TaxID=637679 RepID=A0A1G7DEG8_9PROT|nr:MULTISPECIES: SOS response-associated peptidase [Kordiimonas]SDE49942.1 Putative SOS response-associated peptidase YedK [Kordiimonas lacus]